MIDKSDCLRDFSKKITKKYSFTHKKIRNCNEFGNSLNFAKVSPNQKASNDAIPNQKLLSMKNHTVADYLICQLMLKDSDSHKNP